VALVLHPHPLGGGTMHNKVVFRAAGALLEAGLVTLRIIFAASAKAPVYTTMAQGEREDARVALDYLKRAYPGWPITLC